MIYFTALYSVKKKDNCYSSTRSYNVHCCLITETTQHFAFNKLTKPVALIGKPILQKYSMCFKYKILPAVSCLQKKLSCFRLHKILYRQKYNTIILALNFLGTNNVHYIYDIAALFRQQNKAFCFTCRFVMCCSIGLCLQHRIGECHGVYLILWRRIASSFFRVLKVQIHM